MKEQSYYEHADVRFAGDLLIGVLDEDGRSGIFSTNLGINDMQNHWYGGVPTVVLDKELNFDDQKMSSMTLSIDLNGVKPSKIRNI